MDRHTRVKKELIADMAAESQATSVELTSDLLDDGDGDVEVLVDGFKRGLNGKSFRVDFRFEELSLNLKSGKTILQGVTGEIRAGRMTAIMGPSGAGKTTFLNVMMGKINRTSGRLIVNGRVGEMSAYKKIIGYVPQDDVMLRELSVRENVEYSARCRLPPSWTNAQVSEHVDRILSALNLSHVANTLIGDETVRGISGGQRKRVNIGMELAAAPLALFLDEPTSGLDATAALQVANILKAISQLGLTVVAVIHQPRKEIFEVFEDLLLIGPGGRTAYHGETNEVQSYFGKMGFKFDPYSNPADILMDVLSGKGTFEGTSVPLVKPTVESLLKAWSDRSSMRASVSCGQPTAHDESTTTTVSPPEEASSTDSYTAFHHEIGAICRERGARWYKQVYLAHNRSILQQYRTISTLALETFVSVVAGALMGLAAQNADGELYSGVWIQPYTIIGPAPYFWTVPLYAFLLGLSIALASAPASVRVFGDERLIFYREAASGHSRSAYYTGKTLSSIYRIVLTSLHFSAVYYLISTPVTSFAIFYWIVLMTFWGVYGLGATISMLVKKGNAPLLAAVAALFHGTLCGFGPTVQTDLSFNLWGSEALFSQYVNLYANVYDVEQARRAYGYTVGREATDLLAMFALGLGQRVIAFVLMIVMDRDKQK
ncbi:hypothetical protein HDU93_001005 [Gonapodya sp. JEL0774]|nr:hypothetical protein HDU93_001005 [Gonapodya sp. JEL0774]